MKTTGVYPVICEDTHRVVKNLICLTHRFLADIKKGSFAFDFHSQTTTYGNGSKHCSVVRKL